MKKLIFLIFLLSSIILLISSTKAQVTTYYDQFNGPNIDRFKWNSWEIIREIRDFSGDRKLFSETVAYGFPITTNILELKNPWAINHIEADVALIGIDGNYGPNADNEVALPSAGFDGYFYNDGSGSPGSCLGEVQVLLGIVTEPIAGQPQFRSRWSVVKFTDLNATTQITLGSGILTDGLTLGQTYRFTVNWDLATRTFTFSDGVSTAQTFQVPDSLPIPSYIGRKGFRTVTWMVKDPDHRSSDPALWGKASATFDNIKACQDASCNVVLVTDDFSSAKLDATNWASFEANAQVINGQLISRMRNSNVNKYKSNNTYFSNPDQINEFQAKVVLQEAVKSLRVHSGARIGGYFYNDTGNSNSGYEGDVWVQLCLYAGLPGQNPFALWSLDRVNDYFATSLTNIIWGTFPLPINFNQPYNLYIKWDGNVFIFKVGDYAIPYTPTTPIFPANHPLKVLGTFIAPPSPYINFDSAVTAAFDDVIVYQMSQLTPSGTDIIAQPIDPDSLTKPVTLTFSQITQPGMTSLNISTEGPQPPSGFQLGDPPTYYNLATTATVSGQRTICINYSGLTYSNESQLRLLHYENESWVNITTSQDLDNKIICGISSSFSPFAVMEEKIKVWVDIKPGSDINSINLDSQGLTPVSILSTVDFDATIINPETVKFAEVSPSKSKLEDVNKDGRMDLLLFFVTDELQLSTGATEATLSGSTLNGTIIWGSDMVRIVPQK